MARATNDREGAACAEREGGRERGSQHAHAGERRASWRRRRRRWRHRLGSACEPPACLRTMGDHGRTVWMLSHAPIPSVSAEPATSAVGRRGLSPYALLRTSMCDVDCWGAHDGRGHAAGVCFGRSRVGRSQVEPKGEPQQDQTAADNTPEHWQRRKQRRSAGARRPCPRAAHLLAQPIADLSYRESLLIHAAHHVQSSSSPPLASALRLRPALLPPASEMQQPVAARSPLDC